MSNCQPPTAGQRAALAVAAHPDDIEFLMAGTLILLRRAGYRIHYLNLCSGNCGSLELNAARTRAVRGREARRAARILEARYHPSLTDDLEVFYESATIRRVAAIVREVRPVIVLTHSPQDYMEDHTNTCQVAVAAAFARGMPNYRTVPQRAAVSGDLTVYHAMPHGLRDGMGRRVMAGAFVNTTTAHAVKREALAAHRSQKVWLDATQGMNSYLRVMDEMSRAMGRMSRRFRHAEGWRRHSHLGFCPEGADPLAEALGRNYLANWRYERSLEGG